MHPHRTRIAEDIVAEFTVPNRRSKRTVILCDGMPTVPKRNQLLEHLAKKGFWAISIRYRGTWESDGKFLLDSPCNDVRDTLNQLSEGLRTAWDGQVYRPPTENIFVVGSSFGGAAALLSSPDERVKGAFALSPVVDWRCAGPHEPLDFLYRFVREGFGQAYRFNTASWYKLSAGKFYNPAHEVDNLVGDKIGIIQCGDDWITPAKTAREFAKTVGCGYTEYKRGGHLSLSKLTMPRIWSKFAHFVRGDGF